MLFTSLRVFGLIILSSILLSGCAIFEGNNVPDASLAPASEVTDSPQVVHYAFSAFGGSDGTQASHENLSKKIEEELVAVLEESNYFSQVTKSSEKAPININIVFREKNNPAALVPAFITGLSLYTIPSWATAKMEVVAEVSNGSLNKEYQLADSATIIQWLPMAVVFPFKNFSTISDVRENMYRQVLVDMKADGFFANE